MTGTCGDCKWYCENGVIVPSGICEFPLPIWLDAWARRNDVARRVYPTNWNCPTHQPKEPTDAG